MKRRKKNAKIYTGVKNPQTPIGCFTTKRRLFGAGDGIILPYVRLASSENQSYALIEVSISTNESLRGLPFSYVIIRANCSLCSTCTSTSFLSILLRCFLIKIKEDFF